MRCATKSILAAIVLAFGPSMAAASLPIVVSADEEAEKANPGRHLRRQADDDARTDGDFRATMDRVFGPGRWRQTSGYRTRAQEDALRRQGAGTVPPGRLSRHSLGNPDAPGAYDAVVEGMASQTAAAKLRRAGGAFAKVIAEGPHGGQGPHLHVELISTRER